MLIQALNKYYGLLAAAGKVTEDGFSNQPVSYIVFLNPDGTIDDLADWRTRKETVDKKGKVKVSYSPKTIVLPQRTQKPGIDANFIEHRPLYLFGLNYENGIFTPEDRTDKAKKSHALLVKENLKWTNGLDSPMVQAYRHFLENWKPEEETQNPHLLRLGTEYGKGYYCFALAGHPEILLHEDPAVKDKARRIAAKKGGGEEGARTVCPVTGKRAQPAQIHNKIQGVRGGLSAGGLLVCFNNSAEESYGKAQSFNSGISEEAMKHYCEVLNLLLKDPRHRLYLEDMTLVFWAMSEDDGKEADIFRSTLDPAVLADSEDTNAAMGKTMQYLKDGRSSDFTETGIDLKVEFYIAGLTPNASRISLKFLYRQELGTILDNVAQHQADLTMEQTRYPLPLWRLFKELKSPKSSKDTVPSPLASGIFQAILQGTPYPAALLDTVVRRVKTDSDTDTNSFIKLNPARAGIIKACLNRKTRYKQKKEEIQMALNKENTNQAYLCGRLFAALERIQQNASGGNLNKTIKDSYFSSACAKPSLVFPKLLLLSAKHLEKDEYAVADNILVGKIMDKLEGEFPSTLPLDEQGKFIIGYYQQMQDFYKKKETNDEEVNHEEEEL